MGAMNRMEDLHAKVHESVVGSLYGCPDCEGLEGLADSRQRPQGSQGRSSFQAKNDIEKQTLHRRITGIDADAPNQT
jgi:hypothetical protein